MYDDGRLGIFTFTDLGLRIVRILKLQFLFQFQFLFLWFFELMRQLNPFVIQVYDPLIIVIINIVLIFDLFCINRLGIEMGLIFAGEGFHFGFQFRQHLMQVRLVMILGEWLVVVVVVVCYFELYFCVGFFV